jgi:nucleoside-diphosphate-sugar epimerase
MRIVVVGASGNVGTSTIAALANDPAVETIVGVARRIPAWQAPKTDWVSADVSRSGLVSTFDGADAVIHLAWLIQPSRDVDLLHEVNVGGSRRVFDAVAAAGVPALVYASSVGAYSPGPKDRKVDENWPTDGIRSSYYSAQKAETERILDAFELRNPNTRVVRLRPALIFKHDAGTEIRRLFAGPFLPRALLRTELIPLLPRIQRLVFQAVHSLDVGEAYRLAAVGDAEGAFNIAADPVLDPDELGRILGARPIPLPGAALRLAADLTWRLRLQPTSPGWVDMALGVPLMDTHRARRELGWRPKRTSAEALLDLIEGMREGAGQPTPPLSPATSGPARVREILTGIGGRP